jgi:hypothetical protein
MATILRLVQPDHSDTIEALSYLLSEARHGRVHGLALAYRDHKGNEEAVFTGPYRRSPAKAVNAAMRLSWRMTQLQDDLDR